MKRILRLDRLRLRGLSGARDEVLLTAIRRLVIPSSLPSEGYLRKPVTAQGV